MKNKTDFIARELKRRLNEKWKKRSSLLDLEGWCIIILVIIMKDGGRVCATAI